MRYIQLVEFDTNHPVHEVQQALDAWLVASRGQRTLHMAVVAADHDRANHYWELLEYTSQEEAVRTAERIQGSPAEPFAICTSAPAARGSRVAPRQSARRNCTPGSASPASTA